MSDETPASWEDAAVGASGLLGDDSEEEEQFQAPLSHGPSAEHALGETEEYPVLLVDLTALAAEVGQADLGLVRQVVVHALDGGFISWSEDLFASGNCRHSEKWRSGEDRRRMEEDRGGAVVTVINYPAEIEGMPLEVAWRSVRSPSAWEVVDELKQVIARAHRSIKYAACRSVSLLVGCGSDASVMTFIP